MTPDQMKELSARLRERNAPIDRLEAADLIDSIIAPERWQMVPVKPTREMIEAGAQRLVSWEEGCVWPDSWSPLQVSAARNEADRVWRSMWLAAAPKPGDSNE